MNTTNYLKHAITIGLIGAVLFKLIEYIIRFEIYLLNNAPFYTFKEVILHLVFIVIVVISISVLFLWVKIPKKGAMFIPAVYRFLAAFWNFGISSYAQSPARSTILIIELLEAVTIAVLTGYVAYKYLEKA